MAYYNPPALGAPNRAIDHFSGGTTAPARVEGTIYQAGSTAVIVSIDADGGGTGQAFQVGPASPPTIAVQTLSLAHQAFTAVVPPGWFYRMVAGGAAISTWTETVL